MNNSVREGDARHFLKTSFNLCRDERVSRNKREVTSGKQKIELAKLQLAQLEKEVELQLAKNKALSLNPAAKFEEKQFKTLNKETATHIGIREAEDWFRPIDLAKECDIYISSKNGSRAHACAYSCGVSFPNVSVSNVIENSSYDLPYVKNFNIRNDSNSLIKDYKCNNIKSTKLKMCIKLKNDIPVCQRARRLSCSEKLQVNNQIDDWLRQGIIKESVFDYCSDIVLCKKANGAMKTSSVEFISRSPTPLPMERKYRRFVLLRRIFQPWQWKRRKKRNRFEQTSRTLQRKISMRSTKDQLVEKDVLMPVKHNVFLWNLPDVEEVPSHDGGTV
ncbi:retrovirus-related Pol polyprotein from transposon 17.6 [Trichonephila clavipes]|nr:retrovirus-related Pol polyprotein from transposon 17.6 [Trichonephila clavipes]